MMFYHSWLPFFLRIWEIWTSGIHFNRVMVFNATFNNISVISWQSVLLVEKTTDMPQVTNKHYNIMLIEYTSPWAGFKLTMIVVIGTDCTGNCKSNYHKITTTTAPISIEIHLICYFVIKQLSVLWLYCVWVLVICFQTAANLVLIYICSTVYSVIIYNYSLLLRSIHVFMDLKNDIHRSL